ncbi:hypothetical protein Rhopal_005320-T1 [Rhodotorula paludigena]|uniref:Proteophosphoglycan ppg4 n=1 Tax=Rhodotorula paludigena TaxID=86838 RepID=A0AAV5GQX5_9BASI|nr:hypothetical protein Rhopal_005320-T1 [Rhodotorula paludigena]
MPPKPKGLKASKRAAPVDPATLANDTSAAETQPKLNKEQTMPLDEDALTLGDLFELRTSVLEILYPFPTSLSLEDADPDRIDEARSFLRGILHGCAVLEPFVPLSDYGDLDDEARGDGSRDEENVSKRRADVAEDKLEALGVGTSWQQHLAEPSLWFLQSFALHYLGELFEPPEEILKASAVKNAAGTKRRKVDVREPQTREAWFDAAWSRLRLVVDGLFPAAWEGADDADHLVIMSLVASLYSHCQARYVDALFGAGADDDALDVEGEDAWFGWRYDCAGSGNSLGAESHYLGASDSIPAYLRAVTARIALLEARAPAGPEAAVEELAKGVKELHLYGDSHLLELQDDDDALPLYRFLVDVCVADASAARFLLLEDAVEAKYRPDAGDDDDDEEGEVTPLPLDADEVVAAKKAAEEATVAVRKTLEAFKALPAEFAHPSAKLAQYRKLEEVLLVSSALINPDETDAMAAREREIDDVRKEGGLEQDVAAEGAADAGKEA